MGYEAETNERGEREIWLEDTMADRVHARAGGELQRRHRANCGLEIGGHADGEDTDSVCEIAARVMEIDMTIQRLSTVDFGTLENPGFRSVQIVWPKNAPEALVTITRVTMEPGTISARHSHPNSEQIWIVERG